MSNKLLLLVLALLLGLTPWVYPASDTEATIDFNGVRVWYDADADTGMIASTDDVLDLRFRATDIIQISDVRAADNAATDEVFEIYFSSPVNTTGTNTLNALTIDLAVGNATGGTNTLNGLQIDSVAGDAQVTFNAINLSGFTGTAATERAINIDTGFDLLLEGDMGPAADSAATNSGLDLNFTTPVDTTGTNSHYAINVDFTIGNATGGTNAARALNIANITGDAQVTENAIQIGTGWDDGLLSEANIGYTDGGTVTQATDKSTGVTLNSRSGQITMNAAALAAGAEVSFTVTNSAVDATDVVIVNHSSAGTAGSYLVDCTTVAAGSFQITVSNASAGSLSEAIVLSYAIIEGAST